MEIEEAKQKAEQGDALSMCLLGDYYFKQKEDEEAFKWYRMAVDVNSEYSPYAVNKIVIIEQMDVLATFMFVGMQITEHELEICQYAYEWSAYEIQLIKDGAPGIEKIDKEKAVEFYNDSVYYVALCNYMLGNFPKVLELLENTSSMRDRILLCRALIKTANAEYEFANALKSLATINGYIEYASTKKLLLEEYVYATSAVVLSNAYREGAIEGDGKSNMENAINVLKFVRNYLGSEALQTFIDEELAHYKQGMFGNWKYIG